MALLVCTDARVTAGFTLAAYWVAVVRHSLSPPVSDLSFISHSVAATVAAT